METLWCAAKKNLAESISDSNYKIWIDPLVPLRVKDQVFYLGCPNRFFLAWVREYYYRELLAAVKNAGSKASSVNSLKLEVVPAAQESRPASTKVPNQADLPHMEVHQRAPLRFNRRFTFDRFVVGATNQYAFAAAQAMALGRELNTDALYLLSDHGLGKSHLSQALGQHMLARDSRMKVYYLTAEDFTNELIYSIKNHRQEEFKKKFRHDCDILVLEEIHFLSGKEKIQAELSYTLDSLIQKNRKVVFTSDQLPKDIPRLNRQLVSRLNSSLISTIEAPDYDTRLRILERKAVDIGLAVDREVLEILARRLQKDVRQMESCLNSLGARSELLHRPIDLTLAEETLGDLVETNSDCTLEDIQRLVCRYYRISLEDLCSRSRKKEIVLPRNIGIFLSRKLTNQSLEAIGRSFGRNHSTVLYSINCIENRSRNDPKIQGQIEFMIGQMKKGRPLSL